MKNEKLKVLYTEQLIHEQVAALADQISRDYQGRAVLLVGVLKGAFVFLADLVRALRIPAMVDFVQLSSYGGSTDSSGKIAITKDLDAPVTGRDIIIVEDIIDTGLTIAFLKETLLTRNPRSLRICALLNKGSRRQISIEADYVGITMDTDYFVVGYGLDYSERYRHLPEIHYLEP